MDKLVNREKAKLREVLMSENVKANQRERERAKDKVMEGDKGIGREVVNC